MKAKIFAIGAIAVFLMGAYAFAEREIMIRVENGGAQTMQAVRVVIAGQGYSLGNLDPGDYRHIVVVPEGASRIAIEQRHRAPITMNCQVRKGYGGQVSVALEGQRILSQTCETSSF